MRYPERRHNIDNMNQMSDANSSIRKRNKAGEAELGREIGQMIGAETGDGGEGAGTEADEEDNDDVEDADVLAPPAHTSNETGSQAGLVHGMKGLRDGKVGQKRRRQRESSDEEIVKARVKTAKARHGLDEAKARSDDEDYAGVDLISDTEEKDRTLEQIEEKIIIDSEEEDGAFLSPNPFLLGDWNGLDPMDDQFSISNVALFEEPIRRSSGTDEDAVFEPTTVLNEPPVSNPPPRRRVRFADILESASEGSAINSEDEDTTFPDLFLQQNHLDPSFRHAIEHADDTREAFSLYAGWNGMQGSFGLAHDVIEDEDSHSSCESASGYETDPGETTEEDETMPKIIARPEQLLRRSSTSSIEPTTSSALTSVRKVRTGPASHCYGPTMGSWVADPTKPIAVLDSTGKGMIIIPALRPHKVDRMFEQISSTSATADSSPRGSFTGLADGIEDSENDRSDAPLFESGSGTIMPQQIHSDPTSIDENEDDDDDDDGEAALNVNDFIDFGDDASDSDGYITRSPQVLIPFLPLVPTHQGLSHVSMADGAIGSTSQQILHIDNTQVSAFRRNQERHRAVPSRPAIDASIKGGRHDAANSPLSPLRNRSASNTSSSHRIGKDNSRSLASGNVAKRRVLNNNNINYHGRH